MILGLSAFVPSSALSQESAFPQVEKFPPKSNSVDLKPMEVRLVNPMALSEKTPLGWQTGFIGAFRGTFDLSIGVKFSPERIEFRNVIFGGTLDLAPGIRARANFRRREGEAKAFQIDADEMYLEAYNQYRTLNWNASASLRIGAVRYLHTPYPDAISLFDSVPGVSDLYGGRATGYRNAVINAEFAMNNGLGVHFSGHAQQANKNSESGILEAYGFFRSDFGDGWRFEGRLGAIPVRDISPKATSQAGGDLYLGRRVGEFQIGLLYENGQNERAFGGLMFQFTPGRVTKAIGKVSLDYSRPPDGITAQIPLLHFRLNESRFVRRDDILVGEVRSVRVRTVGEQGFVRNEYEHRLESWGETGSPRLHCVALEEPWYLQNETFLFPQRGELQKYEKSRIGGEQFVQRVTYRFYRPYKRRDTGT